MSPCHRTGVRLVALLALVFQAWAASPPLTTIQDTLFKADGTRFHGVAFVEWKSFDASDNSVIANQSLAVPIVDGVLRVQLVPTTDASPGAYYHVRYNSDGRIQFEETWSVPPSNTPLRLRDIRVGSGIPLPPPGQSTLFAESDVAGLPADLSLRPLKGPGYFPSRVAFVTSTGALETVRGNLTDCVRADGTAAPCGTYFVDGETPSGPVNGTNSTFTLAGTPGPAASLTLHRNGVLQQRGVDFELAGSVITFATVALPQSGDALVASYRTTNPVLTAGGADFPKLFLTASLGAIRVRHSQVARPRTQPAVPDGGSETAPQVLCGATGATSESTKPSVLGQCAIAAGLLRPGDRLEIRFDFSREGMTGFDVELRWADAVLVRRSAPRRESALTGQSQIAVHTQGVQWSTETWGSNLAAAHAAGALGSPRVGPVLVELYGRVRDAGSGTVTLRDYTVVRYPAR